MTSKTHREFWGCFEKLPEEVRKQALEKYRLWRGDPFHPSLHFKPIMQDLWSIRITMHYRALARRRGDLIVWFWIGSHAEYDRLLGR